MNWASHPTTIVTAAYHRVTRALAQRSRGWTGPYELTPDWADPTAVESISLPLPGHLTLPQLVVALRDGIPGRAIPRAWQPWPGCPAIPIATVRAPRAVAQVAPRIERGRPPGATGTAAAIVRDLLSADRHYVLTCGHVVAGDSQTRFGDTARIGGTRIGYLAEWQPAIGEQIFRTGIDAALLEVHAEDAIELRQTADFLPSTVGSRLFRDLPVTLRRTTGPLRGTLKIHWSGYVNIPGVTPGYPDYFLTGAIGYVTDAATQGGDSGAAVWDARHSLMGMHVGALSGVPAGDPNAVFVPIEPVLEWFAVQPYTLTDPAAQRLPASTGHRQMPSASAPRARDEEISIVARTLWGEARGEGERGMRAVGSVILNRKLRQWRGAKTAAAVCLAHKQFSCWNPDDPNRGMLDRIAQAPDAAYVTAEAIASRVIAEDLDDITFGATHYIAASLRRRPLWLAGKQACIVIGRHEFYNDIS